MMQKKKKKKAHWFFSSCEIYFLFKYTDIKLGKYWRRGKDHKKQRHKAGRQAGMDIKPTSGLRSRCTTPLLCMKSTARTSLFIMFMASTSVKNCLRLMRDSSSPPSSSSITTYVCSWNTRHVSVSGVARQLVCNWNSTRHCRSCERVSVQLKHSTCPCQSCEKVSV